MPIIKRSQVINRPVAVAFETVIHVERFASWNAARNPSARRLSEGEIRNGSTFELEIKGFGKVRQELQDFQTNKRVKLVPDTKQIRGGHTFIFTDLGAGKTRIDHELEMTPRGACWLMLPMMIMMGRKNLEATMAALQKHLESGA